jgi:hypothetical protein
MLICTQCIRAIRASTYVRASSQISFFYVSIAFWIDASLVVKVTKKQTIVKQITQREASLYP